MRKLSNFKFTNSVISYLSLSKTTCCIFCLAQSFCAICVDNICNKLCWRHTLCKCTDLAFGTNLRIICARFLGLKRACANTVSTNNGDDYAALSEAVGRRYKRIKKGEALMPDILFLDGGKGQLSSCMQILNELKIKNIIVIAVAKGKSRKPGMEQLFLNTIQILYSFHLFF